jgi:hypothetical protein
MKQLNVYRSGSLHILDKLEDGLGMRVARDFAKQLSYQFASISRRFFDSTGDLPFVYRERQVSTSVVGAMTNFAEAVFAEHPIKRGVNKNESHGWIDYWVIFRNTTFLIELKHCYSTVRGKNKVHGRVSNKWEEAIGQLRKLYNTHCEDLRFGTGEMIKVPLLITTHYVWSGNEEGASINIEVDELCNRHKSIANGLNPGPKWSSLFIVKDDMRGPYKYTSGWEEYPAVSIFLNFETVCRH